MTTEAPTITVTHTFDATPERVFDAWTNPDLVRAWMGSFPDDEVVSVTVDERVGGRFSFLIRRQGQLLDHAGEYFLFDRPERLGFTWGVNENGEETSRVVILLAAVGSGTELTLTHRMDPRWADFAERTAQGWTRISEAIAEAIGRVSE
jgi:uncharacterized protein YndB with AHSA1/START domain